MRGRRKKQEIVEILDLDAESLTLDAETTCTICDAEFLDPEDLTVHINQVHTSDTSYLQQCQFCSLVFRDKEEYAFHIRDFHILELKCCQFCTKAFTDHDALKNHENKHYTSKKSIFSCSQCNVTFTDVKVLEQHEYSSHPDCKEGVSLQGIYAVLSSVLNIKAVTFLQSLSSDAVYICTYCQLSTTEIGDYINHLQINNCRCYVCDNCSNVYRNRTYIEKHFASHKECQPYVEICLEKCKHCNKSIDRHIMKEHLQYCKPIKCHSCNILFKSMYELSEHHSNEHPLAISIEVCKYCNKEFIGTISLQRHFERRHKKELHLYKYHCITCKEVFKHPKTLFYHFYKKHKDLEPYTCKICNQKFRMRKRFTLHIKLQHKSIGFVEFDKEFHVFFTDKKSENPFVPVGDGGEINEDSEHDVPEVTGGGNLQSAIMCQTETDNQTDVDITKSHKRKLITKTQKTAKKPKIDQDVEKSDDSDEPLLSIKRRTNKTKRKFNSWNFKKRNIIKNIKKRFTCKICNKYCYTYQNYNHHMSLHSNKDVKTCIKCSQTFKSKDKLNEHIATAHSSSKLTETLKSLLKKRKSGVTTSQESITMTEKFQRTIKKVSIDEEVTPARITEVPNDKLIQSFIKNFTPESNESKKITIEMNVSVKIVNGPIERPQVIKMTKFTPKIDNTPPKLAMPVKFRQIVTDFNQHKVSINLVLKPNAKNKMNFTSEIENNVETHDDNENENAIEYEDEIEQDDSEIIPDVGHEVMLATEDQTEEKVKKVTHTTHKIVIPNLPEFDKVHIAHLQPEAPYYKIVKVNDILKAQPKEGTNIEEEEVKLPDGTKLINVNPLAHLLDDTAIENVANKTRKYYRPKEYNFESAIAKALMRADIPSAAREKKFSRKKQ